MGAIIRVMVSFFMDYCRKVVLHCHSVEFLILSLNVF